MAQDELTTRARALLEAADSAHDPTAEDRTRIDAAFALKLQSLGVGGALGAGAGAAAAAVAAGAAKRGAWGAGKAWFAALTSAIALGVGVHGALHSTAPTPMAKSSARAATSHVVAPSPGLPSPVLERESAPELPSVVAPPPANLSVTRATESVRHALRPRALGPTVSDTNLSGELSLIARANAELRARRYEAALAALDEHAARFPNGVLREERRGLHALVSCAIAATPAALEERASFLREAPSSVLAGKVREACASSHSTGAAQGAP